jgi:DNA mismatch repair protein MutL
MSDIIHLLPDGIANQIAAGEVIQRPASVVKELVENAIDAGASAIHVVIIDAGKTLIQVVDDGQGMSETDARMAFERHATSKISAADDLFALDTLGFRGEALASIAAVAHVELKTKHRDAELGFRISIAGSQIQDSEVISCSTGAIFSVKNLFFNVPVRRKFLKSNETEFRNIISEFERVALVYPSISFKLTHNNVEVLSLDSTVLRQRIISIYGKNLNNKLLPLEVSTSLVDILGFVARPDSTRKRGALNYFFVNGRYMKHPYFHKAVVASYEHLIPAGELPDYFIYLTIDPSTIDVNIHPTKTEIKFENELPIWQIIQSTIKESLAKSSSIPSIDFDLQDAVSIPVFSEATSKINRSYTPSVEVNSSYNPFNVAPVEPSPDWASLYHEFEVNKGEALASDAKEDLTPHATPSLTETLGFLDIESADTQPTECFSPCYQYKTKYIVTSLKSGLVLIDQQRAHVRVLYDRYVQGILDHTSHAQRLLFPEVVEFSQSEMTIIPSLIDELTHAGIELNYLGGNSYSILGFPVGFEHSNHVVLLQEIVSRAIEIGCDASNLISESIALALAKSAAIRYGKILSNEEMDHLIAELFRSSSSSFTPDGLVIISMLSDEEISSRFRR